MTRPAQLALLTIVTHYGSAKLQAADRVSRVAEGIRVRLDKASARSEMLSGSLDAQMDEVLEKSTLEAQLTERKARLGLSE